jgi:Bacterial SH3 domain
MRFGAALLFWVISTTASAQQFATVTTNAPIYAAAQETPTPLRVAAVGTRLRVLSTEGDWVQVEYNDPQLGRRVGWVLRHYISLTSHDLRPMDLSVPEAPPAPPAPVQPTAVPTAPATSIPFPRWETLLGWSFLHVSGEFLDMNSALGWNVSVAGNVSPWLGIVGDATGNYKTGLPGANEPDVAIHTFTGGPRFSARNSPVAVPFAEFLVGFTRTSLDIDGVGDSSTEFTIQPGGGVDIGNERVAARLSFAWRRVFYEGNPTNMFRFVGGVVIRR